MIRGLNYFAFALLLLRSGVALADATNDFNLENSWGISSFYRDNESKIGDKDTASLQPREKMIGLRLFETSIADWSEYGRSYTNLVYLRIDSTNDVILPDIFQACKFFPRLKYLHLVLPKAPSIPASIALLTNAPVLEHITIQAKGATNVSPALYSIRSLKEINLFLKSVCLSNGVGRLSGLQKLAIYFKSDIECLPQDIGETDLRELDLGSLSSLHSSARIDKWVPKLPPNLIYFAAPGFDLHSIPAAWLHHKKLHYLQLNDNRIASLPGDLRGLPSLKLLYLDDNVITNIPALSLPDSADLKIRLIGNPIREIAPENAPLVKKQILEYLPSNARRSPFERPRWTEGEAY